MRRQSGRQPRQARQAHWACNGGAWRLGPARPRSGFGRTEGGAAMRRHGVEDWRSPIRHSPAFAERDEHAGPADDGVLGQGHGGL